MKKLSNVLYIFLVAGFVTMVHAQMASEKSVRAVAEKSMASKNYFDALSKYKELLEFDDNNPSYLYNAAEAARLYGAYSLAQTYYEKVLSHSDNNNYPKCAYYLGHVKQIQGNYQGAIESYKLYMTERSGDDTMLLSKSEKESAACEWAISKIADTTNEIKVTRFSDNINSNYSEFAASGGINNLQFSSNRFKNTVDKSIPSRTLSNFMESMNEGAAVVLDKTKLNFPGKNFGNASFSMDQTKVIFTICDDINDYDKRCKLYISKIDSLGKWGEPTRLPGNINLEEYSSTQPCLIRTANGEDAIYFVSDRPGGKGQFDIWYSIADEQGGYSEPINVNGINTPYDDITPYYKVDKSILYFSSKGYIGFGGFDVYSSTGSANTHWSQPVNLGAKVNSSFDDVYFYLTKDGKALFSSNRSESKYLDDVNNACCLDIYHADFPECDVKLKTLVFDAITKEELKGVTVKLYDLSDPAAPPLELINLQGNVFNFPLDCNKEYRVEASKPGYIPESASFLSGRPGEFKEILKKLYLKPDKIKLEILTYELPGGKDLVGVTITLLDMDDTLQSPITLKNLNSNINLFENVKPCHKYKIIASKDKYAEVNKLITIDCNARGTVTEKIYLQKFLYSLLPLTLYFDNDIPKKAARPTHTNSTYSNTYNKYYSRKNVFVKRYEGLFKKDKELKGEEMEAFFTIKVKGGKDTLDLFMDRLLIELSEGRKYIIYLKGYASPLAQNDYNYYLGQRRIHSLKNEFRKYRKGVLSKYIKSGMLIIKEKTFGEETAPPGISFEPKDPGSIYHINACQERRVEIVELVE